jgi:hypothetical protein
MVEKSRFHGFVSDTQRRRRFKFIALIPAVGRY